MTRWVFLTVITLCSACGYDYAQNMRPVPGVEPYGGHELKQSTTGALGMVFAEADGATCDKAIAAAFTSLLEQTKAMGGTRVINAQTRGRHNWSGRLSCNGSHASTRGVAVLEKQVAK